MHDHHQALVTHLLERHHGQFSTPHAASVGLDRHVLARLTREGVLVRLKRGWFSTPDLTRGWDGHVRRAESYRADASIPLQMSHSTAAAALRLPLHRVDDTVVHLAGPARAATRGQLRIHHRAETSPARCVPVADAVVGLGVVAGVAAFVVAGDAALARGLCSHHGFHDVLSAQAPVRGLGTLRRVAEYLDARSESVGESLLRLDLVRLGYDVEPQVEIRVGRRRYRVDLMLRGTPVVIEFDGVGKYDEGGLAFRREKQREADLRAAGYVVVRFMWQDLGRPDVIRARIEAALADAPRPDLRRSGTDSRARPRPSVPLRGNPAERHGPHRRNG